MKKITAIAVVCMCTACATTPKSGEEFAGQTVPVPIVGIVPLSQEAGVAVDLTPGLFGMVMNAVNLMSNVAATASSTWKITYLIPNDSLVGSKKCVPRTIVVEKSEVPQQLKVGQMVLLQKRADQKGLEIATSSINQAEISPEHYCYRDYMYAIRRN